MRDLRALNKRTVYAALAIFVIAFSLRFFTVLTMEHKPTGGDPETYDRYAHSIIERGEFSHEPGRPTSWRPPLYPLFLAIIYKLTGCSLPAVGVVQALMGAMTCVFIYLIAKAMFGDVIGIVSGLLSCTSIYFIVAAKFLMTETLFLFLFIASVYFLYRSIARGSVSNAVLSGLLLGLATLVRSVTVLFPGFILLFAACCYRKTEVKTKFLKTIFIPMLIAFIIPISVWTARNYRVHGGFVLISTNAGIDFFIGSTPDLNGRYRVRGPAPEEISDIEKIKSEVVKNRAYTQKAIAYIIKHPKTLVKLTVMKLAFFWSPFDWQFFRPEGAYNWHYGFIMPFALFGIWILARRGAEHWLLFMPVAYFVFVTVLFYGEPRLRIPLDPFLIIFSGYGIVALFNKYSSKAVPVSIVICWLGINFMFYAYSGLIKGLGSSLFQRLGLWQ